MQDANHLPWTGVKAKAETVALGPLDENGRGRCWTAPIDPRTAFAAKLGTKVLAIPAYANDGRWVVMCPDCGSAQIACPDDPRFMCCECANAVIDGLWRPVEWPKDRAKIEALLADRPKKAKNWEPGESLAFLKAENAAHGVGV